MRSGYLFGLMGGVVCGVMASPLLPQPGGIVAFMGLGAAQSLVATVLIWHRTRLPLMTTSTALVTALFLATAWLIGHGVDLIRLPWAAIIGLGIGVAGALSVAERWVHPEAWVTWTAAFRQASFRDMLFLRYIPRLR
jgi:hypothetical protein